ncbi:MAG: thioredoxin domain-containing protein, partial [Alphaproteobacteria bacterium]
RNFLPLATLINNSESLQQAVQVVIIGERGDAAVRALLEAVYGASLPGRVVLVIPPNQTLPAAHPAFGKDRIDAKATAYVCVGTVCSLPLNAPEALARALKPDRNAEQRLSFA